jgi:2-oxoglutarate dehydrogenase complex dehydrogenase (E1) component-like enzyme
MAHRGRLNVLAHVLGMSYADIIAKFEGIHAQTAGTGDVKYHLGAEGTYATRDGRAADGLLAPNPSHLEFVHAVVEGMTRAKQTDRSTPALTQDENLVVPVIIHGDAAFSGQGVVPETLNLARLRGYRTGGTSAHHREQPGRLHDEPERSPLDGLRQRHRTRLRHPGLPRQCRRPERASPSCGSR